MPYCSEQVKIFTFDYIFLNQPRYEATLFVLVIFQDLEPLGDSLSITGNSDNLIYFHFECSSFYIAQQYSCGFP